MSDPFQEIIEDTKTLLQETAKSSKGFVELSPEVLAKLEAIGPGLAPKAETPPVAAAPPVESAAPSPAPSEAALQADPVLALNMLNEQVKACERCGLCKTRTQTVFGVGNPQADLVFVGEAPGFDEDKKGEPFVGRAGQLLTDIITKGMKMTREDVYICNILKCRPPKNRDPNPEEVRHCEPYLQQQLDILQPKVICALGGVAAKTLLKTEESTGRLRGSWHNYEGIPLRVTYHPAYLLRQPSEKAKTWADIQEVMKVLAGEVTPEV